MPQTERQAFWNQRYQADDYAYGTSPNVFFKEQLDKLPAGSILLPADGEGRNGVYAAERGWQVSAFDLSREGKRKAEALAAKRGVSLRYLVGTLDDTGFQAASDIRPLSRRAKIRTAPPPAEPRQTRRHGYPRTVRQNPFCLGTAESRAWRPPKSRHDVFCR